LTRRGMFQAATVAAAATSVAAMSAKPAHALWPTAPTPRFKTIKPHEGGLFMYNVGYQPQIIGNDADNILAIGFNWGEPNSAVFGSGLDDQYSVEAFYRWQLTREIAVTPNIQYIRDPALNPEEDNIWLIGLRARFAF